MASVHRLGSRSQVGEYIDSVFILPLYHPCQPPMNLRRTSAGHWRIDYRARGRRVRETYLDEKAARARLATLSMLPVGRRDPPPSDLQLIPLLDRYCSHAMATGRRQPATAEREKYTRPRLHRLLDSLGIRTVSALTRRSFDSYVKARSEAGISLATIQRDTRTLFAALSHAESRGLIATHPLRGYWRGTRIVAHTPDVLTAPQLQSVFDSLRDDEERRAFWFILATGLRSQEFSTLRQADVSNGILRVWRVQKGGYERSFKLPSLPFTLPSKDPDALLFTTHEGRPWRREFLCRAIKRACRSAGVPEIWTHTLRHAHATYSLAYGENVYQVMVRCGWRSFGMVQRYVAISARYVIEGGNWLPDWTQSGHG